MKVLITGTTGLIGSAIVKECHAEGWHVNYLTTSRNKLQKDDNYKGFYWNPNQGLIDETCFDGVDVIIHLAGASISKRWTKEYKKEIIESRTQTTQLLFTTIQKHNIKVSQIVSASAIGYYPSSLTNYYSEDYNESSNTFLGRVVQLWEEAVDAFNTLDIIVTKIRIGLVLSKDGGALPQIVKPIKFGLGAAFGSGEQWQSWIHIEDLARIFTHTIIEQLTGVYNGVAPNAVTNSELTKTVASVLKKPLILPNIPKFMMKLVLGEMHIILFESQRVSSDKLEKTNFIFNHYQLKPALTDLL
ncbi:MAG: TIGR01777 family protein [Winogradskyella sp.]|nr:TIGR01777 family protein [Winogradskyella sp.]